MTSTKARRKRPAPQRPDDTNPDERLRRAIRAAAQHEPDEQLRRWLLKLTGDLPPRK